MRWKVASHMNAETILRHDFTDEFDEVLQVIEATDIPLRAPTAYAPRGRGGPLKRQWQVIGGERRLVLKPIEQGALNKALDRAFRPLGWKTQPFVDELMRERKLSSYLKGDFAKNHVFLEVEFGNTASMFRDLFKFHMAGRTGDARVGVLVVGTAQMAKYFDSGVSTFETAERLLPYLHIGVQIPVCVLGVEPDDWPAVRGCYELMHDLCVGGGEDCHDFETVWGSDLEAPTD